MSGPAGRREPRRRVDDPAGRREPRRRVDEPLCPSARPETPGARVFGVVDRSGPAPRVRYLADPVPVDANVLGLLQGAPAGEVFRVGAGCAGSDCRHFDGSECSLGERLVQIAPRPAAVKPPACELRNAGCRWFAERGIAVCMSCQWVVSEGETLAGSVEERERLATPG